jgi:hypothetical protein
VKTDQHYKVKLNFQFRFVETRELSLQRLNRKIQANGSVTRAKLFPADKRIQFLILTHSASLGKERLKPYKLNKVYVYNSIVQRLRLSCLLAVCLISTDHWISNIFGLERTISLTEPLPWYYYYYYGDLKNTQHNNHEICKYMHWITYVTGMNFKKTLTGTYKKASIRHSIVAANPAQNLLERNSYTKQSG